MKKLFKKIGLSLAILTCALCTGAGISLVTENSYIAKADEVKSIAASDYYMSGAGIRLINDANGTGLRFHTILSNAEYESLKEGDKTGTLIIPEIRYDGELTLEDLKKESKYRPQNINTTDVWFSTSDQDGNPVMKSTAYLYNIPQAAYGARYVARSYIQYADGSVAYAYTDENRWVSMTDVADTITKDETKSDLVKAQVTPYIISETKVTYNMPEGKVTETLPYGGKATPNDTVSYNNSLYCIEGWTDQFGRTWDIEKDTVTMPLVLTPNFGLKPDKVLDSAVGSNTHTNNPLTKYEGVDNTAAPAGFTKVARYDSKDTWTSSVMHPCGYDNTSIAKYDEVWFALKSNGSWNITNNVDSENSFGAFFSDSWIYFHLMQTSDSVWDIEITKDGKVITLSNQSGIERGYGSNAMELANALSTILYGKGAAQGNTDGASVILYRGDATKTFTIYSTEVLTKSSITNLTGMPVATVKTVTDENGDTVWMLRDGASDDSTHEYQGEYTMAVPTGFTQVKRFDSNTEAGEDGNAWVAGRAWATSYDDTDLSAYSEVWFAVYMSSGYINDRKDTLAFAGNWVYFHLTQTAESLWTIKVVVNGAVKATYADHNAKSGSATLPKDSIAKIIYNTGSESQGIYLFVQNGACSIYSTELVGVLKTTNTGTETPKEDTIVPNVSETTPVYNVARIETESLTVDSAISAAHGSSQLEVSQQVNDTIAPAGFTKVTRYDSKSTWTSSVMNPYGYNNISIASYKEVWFALKSNGSWNITNNKDSENSFGAFFSDSWIYFHLTQTSDSVWDIEITKDGKVITLSNQSGIERGYGSDAAQLKNALSTILYGKGAAQNNTDGASVILYRGDATKTFTIYSTELRASRGERAIYSAFDGAVATTDTTQTNFNGYSSVYKVENFTGNSFAKLDLTGKDYDYVRFAFRTTGDFALKVGNTTCEFKSGNTYYVTLTATENGWMVKVDCNDNIQYTFRFNALSTAVSLNDIFGAMTTSETEPVTAYCTEVRAVKIA